MLESKSIVLSHVALSTVCVCVFDFVTEILNKLMAICQLLDSVNSFFVCSSVCEMIKVDKHKLS